MNDRTEREEKIRNVVEQHLATHDALMQAQDDNARMRAALDLQRQRADQYQHDLTLARAERDHYMQQVMLLMAKLNDMAALASHLSTTLVTAAEEATRAPYAKNGSAALQHVADEIEQTIPKFLTENQTTDQ